MGLSKTEFFTDKQNEIADLFKAVGHPARVAILQHILKSQGCICNDIVNELPLAQPTVSQHLKELKNAGIIKGTISGKSICYCLNTEKWDLIKNFIAEFFNPAYASCCKVESRQVFTDDVKYFPQALELIRKSGLPTEDIQSGLQRMLVVQENEKVLGVAGLEKFGQDGLLRSLAVDETVRGKKLGKQLTERILFKARQEKMHNVYLLTMTADNFFAKLGFEKINRNELPAAIQASPEFTHLCPDSAVAMKYTLTNK